MNDPGEAPDEILFHAARQLGDAEQRAAFLAQACRGEPQRLQRIESLLHALARSERFFTAPPSSDASRSVLPASRRRGEPADELRQLTPHYKLLQRLGSGRHGVVFLAESATADRRRVVFKHFPPSAGSPPRTLPVAFPSIGQLAHPCIARTLDFGTTTVGGLFLVSEYVRGLPLVDYCEAHTLGPAARSHLVCQVGDALEHAHRLGFTHRLLSASNILVTTEGPRLIPKITDFGWAELLGSTTTSGPSARLDLHAFGQILEAVFAALPEHRPTTVIDRCLSSDGSIAYRSMQAAMLELREQLDGAQPAPGTFEPRVQRPVALTRGLIFVMVTIAASSAAWWILVGR